MRNGASNWLMRRKIRENMWKYYGVRLTTLSQSMNCPQPFLASSIQFQCCYMDIHGNRTSVAWTAIAEKLRSSLLTRVIADLFEALLKTNVFFGWSEILFTTWMMNLRINEWFHHVSPIQNGRVFPVERWVPQLPRSLGSSQGPPRVMASPTAMSPVPASSPSLSSKVGMGSECQRYPTAFYSTVWLGMIVKLLWTTMNHLLRVHI